VEKGIDTDDTLECPIRVGDHTGLSCDFTFVYDPTVLEYLGTKKTQQTDQFQLYTHRTDDDRVRVGLFHVSSFKADTPLLVLRFKMKERVATHISIRDLYVNATPLSDIRMDIVVDDWAQQPSEITLLPNYPNPFNSQTVITYQLSD
jgi:hypothetical protein